jgi:hypothetical protein
MKALVRSEALVRAPAQTVWSYATDWSRQGEWVPLTRVHTVGSHNAVGGRIVARTGLGAVALSDPMTITAWKESGDGSASCEMLHTGSAVRGEAGFSVVPHAQGGATFVWWEHLQIPAGPLGALLWKLVAPLAQRMLDLCVHRLVRRVEVLDAAH